MPGGRLRLVEPSTASWRHRRMPRDGRVFLCAPHCVVERKRREIVRNLNGLEPHCVEMLLESRPRDETDVFLLRSTVVEWNDEKWRRRALHAGWTALIGRHTSPVLIGHQTLELLRSHWLNLEPLALDNPRPVCFISKSSKRTANSKYVIGSMPIRGLSR